MERSRYASREITFKTTGFQGTPRESKNLLYFCYKQERWSQKYKPTFPDQTIFYPRVLCETLRNLSGCFLTTEATMKA